MGHAHIDTLSTLTLSPAEERVGRKDKTETAERARERNNEQATTGENDQVNQETNVRDDVMKEPKTDGWTEVKGQVRTRKIGSSTANNESLVEKVKAKRKDERRAHSFV